MQLNSSLPYGVKNKKVVFSEKKKKGRECPALPKGWGREEVVRKKMSAGKNDVYYYVYYYSPDGKKLGPKSSW